MRYNYFVGKIIVVLPAVQVPQPNRFTSHLLVLLLVVLVVTAIVILVFGGHDTSHRSGASRGADRSPGHQVTVDDQRRPVVQAHPVVQELVQPRVPVTSGGPVMTVYPLAQRLRADRQKRGERQHPWGYGRCGAQHDDPILKSGGQQRISDQIVVYLTT